MFPATRIGDSVASTCPHIPSGVFYQASTTHFVDGRGQVRLGDSSTPGPAITASTTHFVDGRPAVNLSHQVSCGIQRGPGSSTVFFD